MSDKEKVSGEEVVTAADFDRITDALSKVATLEAENAKLRAELERRAVPDGFVLAPVKPTEEMLIAGDGYIGTPATYKAMISAIPNTITTEFSQFLSAVMDAAGLVRHGRQSKGLSEYLGSQCMKYRLAAAPAPATVHGVNQQLLEALEKTAAWIEQLPVPTVGAAGQLVKIDKAIAAARQEGGKV